MPSLLFARRLFVVATLLAAVLVAPPLLRAQEPPASAAPDQTTGLAAIEKAVEAKRAELGIPGAALAIVKNDKIVLLKGFGLRDVDEKRPVTPDTLFAVGSSTKAFTALAVLMGVDDNKIRLDDPPAKFLPYFKLQDADANAKITLRDLLCHRSGLARTDLVWYTGKLSREEAIRAMGTVKPTAPLGKAFQYQNVMYAAAGECVAQAYGTSWERLVGQRIFTPLGMKSTTLSLREMAGRPDHAQGYRVDTDTKQATLLPLRDLPSVAPAGAINSSARDMAQWVRLLLGGGVFEGKTLVSPARFDEMTTPQITIGGSVGYGLGWFVRDWKGHKVLEHGGNIDGFNGVVAFMPDQKLGFVLLTNVSASPLAQNILDIVWSNLVAAPPAATIAVAGSGPAIDPRNEAGTYTFAPAGLTITLTFAADRLTMNVPGQPAYLLENIGGRRYKLAAPAPSGFFATFRNNELFLEQPQGNLVLAKDSAGGAAAFKTPLTADELLLKMIAAQGGGRALRAQKSRVAVARLVMENQGLEGEITTYAQAPASAAAHTVLRAVGKVIATTDEFFDGRTGGETTSFSPPAPLTKPALLAQARLGADFYDLLNTKALYKSVVITKRDKVGNEDAFVVVKTPNDAALPPVTEYVSAQTFLVLRRDLLRVGASGGRLPVTETYADYRTVEGVPMPFATTSLSPSVGRIVTTVQSVRINVPVDPAVFRGPSKK